MLGNGILMSSPLGHSILTLGVVSAWVVFMLRTTPRTRRPSTMTISILSLPYSGCSAASALVTSTFVVFLQVHEWINFQHLSSALFAGMYSTRQTEHLKSPL